MSFEQSSETQDKKNYFQEMLVHYLSIIAGYPTRADEIIRDAMNKGINLNLKKAVLEALEISGKNGDSDSFLSILEFSENNGLDIDFSNENIQSIFNDCAKNILMHNDSWEFDQWMKQIKRRNIQIDLPYVFKMAIVQFAELGKGQKAKSINRKREKEKIDVGKYLEEIHRAIMAGVIISFQKGEKAGSSWMVSLASDFNFEIDYSNPEILKSIEIGLHQSLKSMRLGMGGVDYAEQMLKFIKKNKLMIDLNSPEVVNICRSVISELEKSDVDFPQEIKPFSALSHVLDLLKRYKIKI